MNATDLMLGDYVLVEDNEGNTFTDYICDIGYVPKWNELGVRTCKCGEEWLHEYEIMPIPLTKERDKLMMHSTFLSLKKTL